MQRSLSTLTSTSRTYHMQSRWSYTNGVAANGTAESATEDATNGTQDIGTTEGSTPDISTTEGTTAGTCKVNVSTEHQTAYNYSYLLNILKCYNVIK